MNSSPCLSIIVPVYNASAFISICIESILRQSYRDYEMIIVDDGSKDDSGEICDEFAKKDIRIRVIHNNNGGVSSARNTGIEQAKGKYLLFVDADDSINPNMCEVMVSRAEQSGVDYVICGYNEVCRQKIIPRLFALPDNTVMDRNYIIHKLLYSIFSNENIINSPFNKLYRRESILMHGIIFPKRRRAEDWLFNIRYLETAQSALYIDEALYNYIRNEHSAMSRVLPEQFLIWKENIQVRREIEKRYRFNVDWKEVNKHFLEGAIPWAMARYKQDKSFDFNTVFGDKDFIDACNYSHSLDGMKIELVRKMIIASLPSLARLLSKI